MAERLDLPHRDLRGRTSAGPRLREREAVLVVLHDAVRAAAAGRGGAALVTGDAGIGKTSVVRALRASLDHGVRVLVGGCDDLLSPRALGPLREALGDRAPDASARRGPLARALAGDDPDAVPGAVVAELAAWRPTVLIVEDLHWADDATLDVLGHVARRLADLPALLVLTFRDGEVPATHPLRRVLGALAGAPVHRLALQPLSSAAVAGLAAGSGRDSTALYALTGGNPFFVTEALATPGAAVPATVADAVLARMSRLDRSCRTAVEQLSVVPTTVPLALAQHLLDGRLEVLSPAEQQGVLEVRADGLAFRHELARRAVEQGMSVLHRRTLHARVVTALEAAGPRDPARLVHHAVQAGDVEAVLAHAPVAGREAAAAGSHRQALALLEAALRHADRLPDRERARLHDDHAWQLHNAYRHDEAVAESERAVGLLTAVGEPTALAAAQVRLSRHRYMTGDTDGAEAAAADALRTVTTGASPDALASAATSRGTLLALCGHPAAGSAVREAHALAERAGRFDLVALCLNYESLAEADVDVDRRVALLRASLSLAGRHGAHEAVARAYTNLVEVLFRHLRLAELDDVLTAGLAFTDEHHLPSHAFNLHVHRCLLALRRGRFTEAQVGLEALLDQDDDPGMLAGHSRPPYGRLLARRGDPRAGPLLTSAWERALRQRSLVCLAFAGTALVEHAWLTDRPDLAEAVLDAWAPHATRPSAEPVHAELLRYAARAGLPVEPFPGCPQPWADGLRGDWRAAATGWERVGDPYERALELAASGEPGPTLEALHVLDDLGADAAVRHVRRRLRDLGVTRLPRRPTARTRAHPAGLTPRQADVLALLADGLTNVEIADRLVLSVRTVDTHVAAILDRLGVRTRRDAASVARTLRPGSP